MDFTVTFSEVVRLRIRSLLRQATIEGRGASAVVAYHAIEDALRKDANDKGELAYHLPTGTPVHHIASQPLSAYAAIFTAHRLVVLFRFDLMSDRRE